MPPFAGAGTETILVVEDEEQVRDLVRRILAGAGYTVLTASSGDEGEQILSGRDDVQMVITDLVLPGKASGLDIARRVIADARAMHLLCISGYSPQMMSGPDGLPVVAPFLQKPFSASELLKKVRGVMDGAPDR